MNRAHLARVVVAAAVSLLLADFARADDGVLEINHSCAIRTGCFPGDAAGYPVTIDGASGRSYLLTSDLRLPIDTTGIQLSTSSATIDLNGFSILRDCYYNNTSGSTELCLLGTSGAGVETTSANHVDNEVRNGSIQFVGGVGVDFGSSRGSVVRNLRVSQTGGGGIQAGVQSLVEGCTVRGTGANGIGAGGVVRNNSVEDAGSHGISTGSHSTVAQNRIVSSGLNGIIASDSVVRANTVDGNGQNGIAALRSTVIGNISTDNTLNGISCTECVATANRTEGNGGSGIFTDSSGAYGDNALYDTTAVSGPMSQVSGNVCNGNTTCP